MDIRKVKKLIELLEESGVSEIEIHEGEESVRISRSTNTGGTQTVTHTHTHQQEQETGFPPPSPAQQETAAGGRDDPLSLNESGHIITSPMVGTFYSSSSPGSPPFVDEGDPVSVGDVICIIEAMKIMNQVESDVDGVLSRILVENGDPVEYGQPLFVISKE